MCQGAAELPCEGNKPRAEGDPNTDHVLTGRCSPIGTDNSGQNWGLTKAYINSTKQGKGTNQVQSPFCTRRKV